MRNTSEYVVSAQQNPSYYPSLKATVYGTRFFIRAVERDNPYTGADTAGMNDDPKREAVGYSEDYGYTVTFLHTDSDTLQYCKGTSSTLYTISTTECLCKPGFWDYRQGPILYIAQTGYIRKLSISWSLIDSGNTSPLTLSDSQAWALGAPLAIHPIDDNKCIVLSDGDGGIQVSCVDFSNNVIHTWPYRFMFPKQYNYTTTDNPTERTMESLALFSGVAYGPPTGYNIFVYISNNITGQVIGVKFDNTQKTWSDTFVALPTDLEVSLCEFRISSVFVSNYRIMMAGQFRRTDALEDSSIYNMILYSHDGLSFAIDRWCAFSALGYRFQVGVYQNQSNSYNYVFASACNRNYDAPVPAHLNDGGGTQDRYYLNEDKILSFDDGDLEQASMTLAYGDYTLNGISQLIPGSIMKVYYEVIADEGWFDYNTTYGTYVIQGVSEAYRDGQRSLQLQLMNESQWKLAGYSMPFYAEIIGKSAQYEKLVSDSGELFTADTVTKYDEKVSVDFWGEHEQYTDANATPPITSRNWLDQGGIEHANPGSNHRLSILSKEIKNHLFINDNPEIAATSVTFELYGHSRPESGSTNDIVELLLITEDDDGTETVHISNEDKHWPCFYPSTASGDYPIVITVTGLTVGHRIKQVGMIFENSGASWDYPCRVDIIAGAKAQTTFRSGETPWTPPEGVTEGFKIPGSGAPHLMFSQKPFNAFNFRYAAEFTNTMEAVAGLEDYPLAVGIVGHAENGSNYTVGRWNRANDRAEIVKVRGGEETVLAYTDISGLSLPDRVFLLFEHRDGKFTLFYKDANKLWTSMVSYVWEAADGWMFTSTTASMRCGIYGFISGPSFLITGLDIGGDEDTTAADAIAHLPCYEGVMADFPATGSVTIGNNTYAYTGKVTAPSPVRGPFMFRQSNLYTPPYGDGHGLECRDQQWTASPTMLSGKIVASDDGSAFVIDHNLWQIFNRTAGVRNYYPNRARYYSTNSQISARYMSFSNRIYATGGLTGFSRISGEDTSHSWGDLCTYKFDGEIWCWNVYGSSGEQDRSLADLLLWSLGTVGAWATFPGDKTISSSSGGSIATLGQIDGIDVTWSCDPSNDQTFTFTGTMKFDGLEADTSVKITIHEDTTSDYYEFSLSSEPSSTVIEKVRHSVPDGTAASTFRIYAHQEFISIYLNNQWVHTFCTPGIDYEVYTDVSLGGTNTFTDILIRELSDWRESVYIDLNTDGRSAISSIIQERPVDIICKNNGDLAIFYDMDSRPLVEAQHAPREHQWQKTIPSEGASDAIVINALQAKTQQFLEFLEDIGFATRVQNLPNLYSGAYRASNIMLERAYESKEEHSLTIRPDMRLEPGDILRVDYSIDGTNAVISADIIVESLRFSIKESMDTKTASMSIRGRRNILVSEWTHPSPANARATVSNPTVAVMG
jgi:hypothetical protein